MKGTLRQLILVLLVMTALEAVGQPATITFVTNSELETEVDSVDAKYVHTTHGPYDFRGMKRVVFSANLPDSASIQLLQSRGIVVYQKTRRVETIVMKPVVQKQVAAPPAKKETTQAAAPAPTAPAPDAKKGATATSKISSSIMANQASPDPEIINPTVATGIGIGLDYGGIGAKLTINPLSPVSIFGGLGYNFDAIGFNGGLELNFSPQAKKGTGFLSAMYGYNAVLLQPSGSSRPAETFFGPSFGLGAKMRSVTGENFFIIQLIYPIRDQVFMNQAEKPWPILFSLGYHFGR